MHACVQHLGWPLRWLDDAARNVGTRTGQVGSLAASRGDESASALLVVGRQAADARALITPTPFDLGGAAAARFRTQVAGDIAYNSTIYRTQVLGTCACGLRQ